MKAKDLKSPTSFEKRRPLIEDKIFFLPVFYEGYEEFSFPEWESLFATPKPIRIEYGSGNGTWLCERAKGDPKSNWVGIEIRFDRVRKIFARMKNEGLQNLFIVSGDGKTFTHHYVREETVDEIFINFPDPWPKRKHHKHRLINDDFVQEMVRALKKGGSITLVTDDPIYRDVSLQSFLKNEMLNSKTPPPHFEVNIEGYGASFFETLWKEKGREIYYITVVKA